MKMRLNIVMLSVFFSTHLFGQLIPNASFEQWDNSTGWEEPVDWSTPNADTQVPFVGFETVEPSLDSYDGTYSVSLETKSLFGMTIPGLLTLGTYANAAVTGGIPYTLRPEKLTGYFKYSPMGNDSLMVAVHMFKYNTLTGFLDTIGLGIFTYPDVVDTYTLFELDITYLTNDTPDTMNIIIMPSATDPVVGSVLLVDNLSFVHGQTPINTSEEITICEGDSLVFGTQVLFTEGEYIEVFTTGAGVDSTVTLTLIVNPSLVIDLGVDTTICFNETQLTLDAGIADSYLWSDGSENQTLLVDNSILGDSTYSVTVTSGNCSAVDTVTVTVDICDGVITLNETFTINIYPNPSKGLLNLEINSSLTKDVTINLYDLTGKAIMRKTIKISETKTEFDLSTYPKGIYYLKIASDYYVKTEKIILQ